MSEWDKEDIGLPASSGNYRFKSPLDLNQLKCMWQQLLRELTYAFTTYSSNEIPRPGSIASVFDYFILSYCCKPFMLLVLCPAPDCFIVFYLKNWVHSGR